MDKYKQVLMYVVLLVVTTGYGFTIIQPKYEALTRTLSKINSKKPQKVNLEREYNYLKKNENGSSVANTKAKEIYKPKNRNLDMETSFGVLFDEVIDYIKLNEIKVRSINYTYNPEEDPVVKNSGDKFNVCQLDLKIISTYKQLQVFLKDLYRYEYLLNVVSIDTMPYQKNKKLLQTDFKLRMYVKK